MAKIIPFANHSRNSRQKLFEKSLAEEIRKVEEKLNIPEDEPLVVMSDMDIITIANCLMDARDEISRVLDILGVEEGEGIYD